MCSGSVLSSPFSMFGNFLNLLISCLWIVANGLIACFGMVGCLYLMAFIIRTPGLPLLVIWRLVILNGALVLIRWTLLVAWTPPEYWDTDDIALDMSEHPFFGLMVAGKTSLL